MNKKNNKEEKTTYLSFLVSSLPEDEIESIKVTSDLPLSLDKIAKNAFDKKNEVEQNMNNKHEQKKKPIKLFTKFIASVAIIATLSVTAFAFSQTDMMRSLFGGKDKNLIDTAIITPVEKGEANGITMGIQSVLTDGYITNIIVSIENASTIDIWESNVFTVTTNLEMTNYLVQDLENFSTEKLQYFIIQITNAEPINNTDISIELNPTIAPITLNISAVSTLDSKIVVFPANTMQGDATLEKLQISPMGFLLNVKESSTQGGLDDTFITVVFNDGETEEIETSFMAISLEDDHPIMGGGGVIINPDLESGPLVVSFFGERNGNGELSVGGQFSRIINTENIKEIIINGVTYPVNS